MPLASLTSEVFEAARRGDQAGWRVLYDSVAPRVAGYFRARRLQDVDDLVGQVFLEVARRIGTFAGGVEGFRGWVFAIAHSRYVDAVRAAHRRQSEPLDAVPEPVAGVDVENEVLAGLERERLLAAIDHLTAGQRSVILLRVFGDLSAEETAEALGTTAMAVRVNHFRAVRALEERLTGELSPRPAPRVESADPVGGVTK